MYAAPSPRRSEERSSDPGIRGTDDAEFVRNAMRWYAQNKHGLVLNRLYDDNKVMAGADYSKVPLFVERRNDKAPGGGR